MAYGFNFAIQNAEMKHRPHLLLIATEKWYLGWAGLKGVGRCQMQLQALGLVCKATPTTHMGTEAGIQIMLRSWGPFSGEGVYQLHVESMNR